MRDAHAAGERACTEWLSAALAYAHYRGSGLRTEIRIGPLARQLATTAAAHHADLLVLGSSCFRVRWPFSGGTADRVSRRSRCPVMMVP
ncbi:MAG: universal stress protein [Streptosporangiaceae bacterium]